MFRKISAILIPCLIAIGILAYMLYMVWDDLLISLRHIVPAYHGTRGSHLPCRMVAAGGGGTTGSCSASITG